MRRLSEDEFSESTNGRTTNKPRCERCGRPVRVSRDDYDHRDEILCPICASDAKVSSATESEYE